MSTEYTRTSNEAIEDPKKMEEGGSKKTLFQSTPIPFETKQFFKNSNMPNLFA